MATIVELPKPKKYVNESAVKKAEHLLALTKEGTIIEFLAGVVYDDLKGGFIRCTSNHVATLAGATWMALSDFTVDSAEEDEPAPKPEGES